MVLRAASIGVLPARTTRTPATRVEGPGAGEAEAVGGGLHTERQGQAWLGCLATLYSDHAWRGGEAFPPLPGGGCCDSAHALCLWSCQSL